MKKLLLAVMAFAPLSMSVYAGDGKTMVMHNGHLIEISNSALPAHLGHGDDIMVYYHGSWITLEQYNAIISSQNDGGSGSDWV